MLLKSSLSGNYDHGFPGLLIRNLDQPQIKRGGIGTVPLLLNNLASHGQ